MPLLATRARWLRWAGCTGCLGPKPILALAAALLPGCAASPLPARLPAEDPPGSELRVQLLFGAEADLDLYVTDPFFETVYFANTPSRASGGALEADRRCGDPAPRVETVHLERPPAGRYRVSVDYPERCGPVRAPVPFRVVVERGAQHEERSGEISLGEFLPMVLKFDWRER